MDTTIREFSNFTASEFHSVCQSYHDFDAVQSLSPIKILTNYLPHRVPSSLFTTVPINTKNQHPRFYEDFSCSTKKQNGT
jgi:hypothetical protein